VKTLKGKLGRMTSAVAIFKSYLLKAISIKNLNP